MPQVSANLNILESTSTAWFAWAGMSRILKWSSATWERSTDATGRCPSAGRIWRSSTRRHVFTVFGRQFTSRWALDVALGELGHGRRRGGLRRERDPRRGPRRSMTAAARLRASSGATLAMHADAHAFGLARRPPRLGHVDLAPGRVDPDTEAREVTVPEQRVAALHGQAFHRPLGNPNGIPSRHRSHSLFCRPEIRKQTGTDRAKQ